MKYCKRCGLRVEDNTSLCPKCGGMDFVSEEEKARMSNGQSAPNRRPAQNPGMGANRPVRPNGTQPARPQGGQQMGGQQMGGQQRPMQGQSGMNNGQQRPIQGGQQRPVQGQVGQRPMQGQGGQQRPIQNAGAQDLGGYGNNTQNGGYNQSGYNQQSGYVDNIDTMDEQDVFNTEIPETVEDAKKKKKKEKAAKKPKAPTDSSVVTMKDWLVLWFKLIVPILNIVCIIQILTDKNGKYNESMKNYVKAYLIMSVISLIAGIAGSFAVTALIGSMS